MRKMTSMAVAVLLVFSLVGMTAAGGIYTSSSTLSYTSVSSSTFHTFTDLPAPSGMGWLTVNIRGDFNGDTEFAEVYIEGTYIGRNQGSATECDTNWTLEIWGITQSEIETWAADGQIVVEVANTADVGTFCPFNQHQVIISYPTNGTSEAKRTKTPSLLPLASTNIAKASDLLTQAESLLSDAKGKNLDTAPCEKLMDEAKGLLAEAKLRKASPTTANYFALKAAEKLQAALECLKALLG